MTSIERLLGKTASDIGRSNDFANLPSPEVIGGKTYIEVHHAGVSFVLPTGGTVSSIQLHSDGHEGYAGFRGEIPYGLSFDMRRDAVRSVLGKPTESGENQSIAFLGNKNAWDRFLARGYSIHVEYNEDKTAIQLISLSVLP